jgi:peptide/nickel transport system substrate-binding protein
MALSRRGLLAAGAALPAAPLLARPALAQPAGSRVLRLIHGSDLASVDPIWTTAAATSEFGMNVFDQLLAVDSAYAVRPQMAEGWQVEDDGRTYVFTLREGLRFHDGEPVRSADCIASIARWASRDGFGQTIAAVTDRMRAIDDRRFAIHLKRRFPLLLDALAKPNSSQCYIMPERLARQPATTALNEAVGSGPFRFLRDEWISGAQVNFARFDQYVPRQEAPDGLAGGRVAKIDRMEWRIIADAGTALSAMLAGEHDYWDSPLPDQFALLRRNARLALQPRLTAGIYYTIVMNHLHPPFDNPAIRQAVAMAVNQADFMDAASGGQPGISGYCASFYTCGTAFATEAGGAVLQQRSLERGRAALRAAGYQGEKVVLLAAADPPAIGAIGQVTNDLLTRLGFNVEFVATDYASMTQRRVSREPVSRGGWSVFNSTFGAVGLTNPAVNILMRGAGEKGWFGWAQDEALEAARAAWFDAADPEERLRLATAVQERAFATLPYIPLGYTVQPHVWRSSLQGVFPAPIAVYWNIEKTA